MAARAKSLVGDCQVTVKCLGKIELALKIATILVSLSILRLCVSFHRPMILLFIIP